ncbi:recombinase B [Legionella lansingensis]|uniref:Recombinase B n=1 Tax=Legionella lansingensis TaxID=45067 RepID=A0A0W0VU02_9GAMM|nr:PD-(D/E)XK nuclease family protein [Legionella lansingensis]KTD23619.1 recombinase B [Legionella lansingensis]SNV52430.1 recombinase B [Legionella lansingensis]
MNNKGNRSPHPNVSTSRPHDLFAGLTAGSIDLEISPEPAVNPANKSWGRDVGIGGAFTNKEELLALMQNGATVITPNNRLSNELLHDFAVAFPKSAQKKPICLPYTAFLLHSFKTFWHKYSRNNHPLLLTELQCRYLWRQIIATKQTEVNRGLLNAIHEAWTRCHLWMLDLNHSVFAYNLQTRQFQQWAQQFLRELDCLGAITEAQLAPYLCSQNSAFSVSQLVWVCFDDYTPQQKKLQHYLNDQGCMLYHYDLATQATNLYQYAAKNEEDEYQQLFCWLKERLACGERRLGVVIPDLEKKSSYLHRTLQQHFPQTTFNISLGKPLAEYPLVAHALNYLQLDGKMLDVHQARLLLHSPFIAYSQTELLARAQILENSTTLAEPTFEQSAFVAELKAIAPKLAHALTEVIPYPKEASIQGWINAFHLRLRSLGFPGELELNSVTYQCYQRFLMLFEEFKQLALISPLMKRRDALATFKELAETTIFQPKNANAPIQILGLLEASGCTFNSLWFTGLTDECLPQGIKPSAFIPLTLQRDNLMPHAHSAKELYLADKMISRLQRASSLAVFSYPRLVDDKPNMPSPFITHLATLQPMRDEAKACESKLEHFSESYVLPFVPEEKLAGGTSILANQAKCPFRAFAAHRLHLKARIENSAGPDQRERGQVIHKVMELLWGALKKQSNLLELDNEALDKHIETSIQTALQPLIAKRPHSFSNLVQAVEFQRLKRLVHACLDWERQRPPFEVEALEAAFTIRLADMEFNVRVDRLDKVEDDKWVIDYKTSLPQSLPWNEERPSEPQLLLYALLDETISTLLFAQLKAGKFTPKGLSENKNPTLGIVGLKKDQSWSALRQYWSLQLTQLAHEFVQGHCPPRPNSLAVCTQCDYQALCRFEGNSSE